MAKSLTFTCDRPNERGTFSEGDMITGTVTLVLQNEVKVKRLYVKVKGDAKVEWEESSQYRRYYTDSYREYRRIFKLKQFLVGTENSKGIVVPGGTNSYRFGFRIPEAAMPSSFRGVYGKIVYKVEVVLSRSWRLDSTKEKEITFASKCFPNPAGLMLPQVGSVTKDLGLFSKGQVHMDVRLDRRAYAPGEDVMIVAEINNSSSSNTTLKFSLTEEAAFYAMGSYRTSHRLVVKRKTDACIRSNTNKTVRFALQIPPNLTTSIEHFDLISVDYFVKVYLDISYTTDPEVILPVKIIPEELAHALRSGMAAGPYPTWPTGGPSDSDFPLPGPTMGPYSPFPQSNAPQPAYPNQVYEPFAPNWYPAQPPNMAGGFSNPVPPALSGPPFSWWPQPPLPTYNPLPPAPSAPAISNNNYKEF